jgi:hypothetical protein
MLERFAVFDSDSLRLAQRSITNPKFTRVKQSDCLVSPLAADHTPDVRG